ncbi:hypothetical protein [Salinimicrobium gaetbulicola]|uniref:Uncharacterized protein n=1 Tax=Salinimicrobium gaetbulicola TaxID=999702 RepID=A0ABW3IG32_9FLAO
MKFKLIIVFIFFNLTAFSQDVTVKEIDNYIGSVDSNSSLKLNEYDWNEITGSHIDHGATLKIWKLEGEIVKIEEQFGASYGRYTRLTYLKNNKPIKGIETEENFEFNNDDIDYSNLNIQFKMEIFVTRFNDLIGEYEFDVIEEGKRMATDPYCDLNSFFTIIDEIDDL